MDNAQELALAYAQVVFKDHLEKRAIKTKSPEDIAEELNFFKGCYEYAFKYYSNFDKLSNG